eukprot:CAMPEP_0181329642 /NCGR_PEP_ID=MMETSP1101-20121128/23424_1 /TAXON_ID=46948 /ORGANISM="Rhodomonas abbreviata, Strain Caron Lab Isolate" /LENGTH=152 /DNA_ID=CAMNT_0023438743 /DNA_START=33 /DNA_END=487 /DNA_ORIENTATION=+
MSRELEKTARMVTLNGEDHWSNCADSSAVTSDLIEECGFNGGDILIALMGLQIGAQGLGLIEPSITAFTKARKAAQQIIEVIDRALTIDSFDDKGEKPSHVKGRITFENVEFTYPSRPDQQVCRGYNLTVEAGTTVALVGASGSGKSTAIQL